MRFSRMGRACEVVSASSIFAMAVMGESGIRKLIY